MHVSLTGWKEHENWLLWKWKHNRGSFKKDNVFRERGKKDDGNHKETKWWNKKIKNIKWNSIKLNLKVGQNHQKTYSKPSQLLKTKTYKLTKNCRYQSFISNSNFSI